MKGVILLEKQQQKDPVDSSETLQTIPSRNEMGFNQGMRKDSGTCTPGLRDREGQCGLGGGEPTLWKGQGLGRCGRRKVRAVCSGTASQAGRREGTAGPGVRKGPARSVPSRSSETGGRRDALPLYLWWPSVLAHKHLLSFLRIVLSTISTPLYWSFPCLSELFSTSLGCLKIEI